MARNRRGNAQRIETSVELVKVVAHTQGKKTIYRGIIKHEDKEYYFTANTKCIPVVLGAPNIELMKETAKAINNWHKANKRGGQFYTDIDKLFNGAEIKLYTKEMSNGIFMLKNSAGYMGYLPGAAGIRAVYMNHKDQKPYSCALKSWGKLVDNNEAHPFRTMASQGQKIREEMIPELMRIKAILDKQTNKPDPDGPGSNRTKEEPKQQPDTRSEVQIEKETQQTQEEPQRTTRRRRRTTVIENTQEQQTVKKSEIVICYCGSCNCDTEQERVNKYEVMCKECGSQWEYFPEETEEVKQEETKEEIAIETVEKEIVVEETKEKEPQISVEEEMEQTMKHEEKKVEEQVREELEQRSKRRKRARRTVEEVPQVTNEDMHGRETNDESTVVRQDTGAEEIPSNTNDVSNIPTNDESTEDECDDSYDVELDTDADEAGDSFEVEAGILW